MEKKMQVLHIYIYIYIFYKCVSVCECGNRTLAYVNWNIVANLYTKKMISEKNNYSIII